MGEFLPLKNRQISQTSQYPLSKLLHRLNGLCNGIFYQILFKVNFVGNQKKFKFCLTTSFLSISISDPSNVTVVKHIKVNNF